MKILVLCLPGLGDALMATPLISALRKEYPKAVIDVGCMFTAVEYIFKNNKNVDNVYFLPLYKHNRVMGVLSLLPMRKHGYDVSILAYPAYRREYHIVQWIMGAKKRIAHNFGHNYWSEFNFLDTDFVKVDEGVHIVINNMNLLGALGIDWKKKYKPSSLKYDLKLDDSDIEFGNKYIGDLRWRSKIIGLHPGSINSKLGMMKRWPVERFSELAKKLIKKGNKILVFVGPDELDLGRKLMRLIGDRGNVRLVENMKLNQALGVLNQVDLLITNDNGFAHLANALKKKSIVLYGPTNSLWCRPYDDRLCKIVRKAKFEPWFRNDMKVENPPPGARSGTEAIEVSDVVSLLKDF